MFCFDNLIAYNGTKNTGTKLRQAYCFLKIKMSELRSHYPDYFISKNKVELTSGISADRILDLISEKYAEFNPDFTDGLKIDFPDSWIHLRKSNTEPILRIYAESDSKSTAEKLAEKMVSEIVVLMQ